MDQLIPVEVPSSPQILHDDVLQAMSIWNQAMKWFQETYDQNDPLAVVYEFIESSGGTPITIHSVDLQTLGQGTNTTNPIVSFTELVYSTDTGQIVSAQIYLLSTLFSTSNNLHLYTVLFAFGSALGLKTYPQSAPCPFQDLMCPTLLAVYPSTLDLYAVHLLAEGRLVKNVTLPSDIPYQQAPGNPIPEFTTPYLLLLTLVLQSVMIHLRTSKSRGRPEAQVLKLII
jgi:hypothetical protein